MNTSKRLGAICVIKIWLIVSIISQSNVEGSQAKTSISSKEEEEFTCGFYLAESSIPNSGGGMYSMKDIKKGEAVGEVDTNIMIEDIEKNNGGKFSGWTHFDYFWMAEWRDEFLAAKNINVNAFPVGSLANFHTFFKNAYPGDVIFRNMNVTRFTSPGAGAFSYQTRVFEATRDIKAGEEVFANYGEPWLDDHKMDHVPREKHFRRAERVMNELTMLRTKLPSDEPLDDKFITSLNKIVSLYDDKTASLLPIDDNELSNSPTTNSLLADKTLNVRSKEWILENGICIDTLVIKGSTMPHAGLGAFTKRSFRKDELIIPMPLLHIRDKNTMNIYYAKNKEDTSTTIRKQILLNYCHGHHMSNLVLCPSTHGAFINHKHYCDESEKKECSADAPNAKIIWSSDDLSKEWLSFSLDDLAGNKARGLSFDIVATRDIEQGEEVFIDYGKDWQNAWNNHVASWKPPSQNEISYVFPKVMNDENEDELFYTVYEQEENPYPDNIITICTYWEEEGQQLSEEDPADRYEETHMIDREELVEVLEEYGYDGSKYVQNDDEEYYWPCQIYKRSDDGDTYVVRITQLLSEDKTRWSVAEKPRMLFNFSLKSIMFAEKAYVGDQFLENAFRHPIGIPDEIFPKEWMDLVEKED